MIVALLAVAVGAAILSGLITIYYDIPRQMGLEFRSYGANLVFIPSGDAHTISSEDAERALSYLDTGSVIGAAPYRYQMIKINEQPFMAAGTDLRGARATSPYWLVSGRWPESAGEALVGAEAAAALRLPAGSPFTVTGTDSLGESFSRDFTITGLLQTGGAEEAFIFMSLADFRSMMREEGKLDVVECSVSAARETLETQAARIAELVPGVSPTLVKKVTDSEGTVLTKLQALIYLVTVIVLLLIMICVATTMMAVIAERRREIGLRKALGASNNSLIIEFIGEGMFLGGFGGLLGAVLGFMFAQIVGLNVFNRSVTFQPLLAPVTLAASILVTAIACVIPVRSATDVDPAIVLRGE
jgi:putative ABC transport system permease protein